MILTGGPSGGAYTGIRGWSTGHLTGFTELYSMNTPLGVGGWCLGGLTVCADQVPGGRGGCVPLGGQESHAVALGSLQNMTGLGDDAQGAAVREAHAWAARLRAHGVRVHVCTLLYAHACPWDGFSLPHRREGRKRCPLSHRASLPASPHPGNRKTSLQGTSELP